MALVTALAATLPAGCGTDISSLGRPAGEGRVPGLLGDVPPDPPETAETKVVVLDWTGGSPDILAYDVSGLDISQMYMEDGHALAWEQEAELQDAVLARMEEILTAIQPADFRVIIGEAESHPDATVVFITGDLGAGGAGQAGQTKLDQCDLKRAGDIVVWGGSLLALGDGFTFEEWVHLLANVATHEVGHTVGFFHPDAFMTDLSAYEMATEVMMAVRTLLALRGPQGFIIPQETCPSNIAQRYGGVAYGLSADSTTRPAAKATVSTSRAACVCRVVADD